MVFENAKLIDALQIIVPESKTSWIFYWPLADTGDFLVSKTYKSLKWLIHTGFYSYPGTYKFRVHYHLKLVKSNLVYASKNFNRLSQPTLDSSLAAVGDIKSNQMKALTLTQLQDQYQKILNNKVENVIIAGDP